MDTVRYEFSRDIPLQIEADVIVVGGGPGGLGAAVMAARAGAEVVLVERYGLPGGMASVGEVHPFMPNHVKQQALDHPVYVEWVERIHRYLPEDIETRCPYDPEANTGSSRMLSKDVAAMAAEDLLLEAGVRVIYHHAVVDVLRSGRMIDALVLGSKSGYSAARAKVYVDCSGDGDVAALAGCGFEQGGPSGHSQPMTLCFKLSGVDRSRIPERKELNTLFLAAKERGEINSPREDILSFSYYDEDVVHFNTTRVIHKNAVNGLELAAAELEGHSQMREYIAFFRKYVTGFENAMLHSMAHHIGVRESRRVKGIAYATREVFDKAQKFADGIARIRYMIDIHNPNGSGTEKAFVAPDDFYEVPYGCVVAADVDNLTVGGRPVSVDHALHSSLRVMPSACSLGQAAGMGAALAVRDGVTPAAVDGKKVRAELIKKGARL